MHLKQGSKHIIKHNTYHKPSINALETLIIYLSMFHHIINIKPKHKCMTSPTYLSTTQHLQHWWMGMWMNGMVSKRKKNPNLASDSKQAYEAEVQACINMWTNFKKGVKHVKQTKQTTWRIWIRVFGQVLAYIAKGLQTQDLTCVRMLMTCLRETCSRSKSMLKTDTQNRKQSMNKNLILII